MDHLKGLPNLRKFVIVEFPDGLQVVSKNWQINHLQFYYPNAVKDIKEYNKLLINMASPDDGSLNWTSYTIKKIYGSDDNLKNAISKLNQAKNYSDIDEESPKYRHNRCIKMLSSSDDELSPPMFRSKHDMKSKIIDEFPKPPNAFTSKQTRKRKNDSCLSIHDQDSESFFDSLPNEPLCTSTQVSVPGNDLTSYEEPKTKKSPIISQSNEIIDIGINNKSGISDSDFFKDAIELSLFSNNHIDPDPMRDNDITGLNFEELCTNEGLSVHNKVSSQVFDASKNIREENNIIADIAELNLKVQKVLVNQNTILDLLKNLQISNSTLDENVISSGQKKDFELHYTSIYPLTDLQKFQRTNKMLETEFYYELMKKKVASFGGADVNSAVRIIMSKLFSNKLGIDITLTGTSLICKDKQSLQKSNFYKLIIESIRILFNTATEEQIKKPIASWLKHAKERSNRQNNTL